MKRGKLLAILLCVAMLIALGAACNKDNGESSTPPSEESTPGITTPGVSTSSSTPDAVTHDTLNIAATRDDGTLAHENMQGEMFSGIQLVNEPLWGQIRLEAPDVYNILGEGADVINNTEQIIHLKPGINFSNGNPFTASDFLFSIRVEKASPISGSTRGQLMNPDKSEIIDDYTVHLVWDDYHGGYMGLLGDVMMVDEESYDIETASVAPIGTGPYVVKEYVLNSHLFLERRDDYWGELPPFKYINFRVLREPSQVINALETGMVDLAFRIDNSDVPHIRSLPGMQILNYFDTSYVLIGFNLSPKSKLHDIDARYAVCHAIDRQAIVDVAYDGMAQILNRMAPLTIAGDTPDFDFLSDIYRIGYDQERARELAQSSGLAGQTVRLMNSGTPELTLLSEMVQDMLKEIGVDVQIVSYDPATVWTRGMDDVNAEFWDMQVSIGINPGYSAAGALVQGFLSSAVQNTPSHWEGCEEYWTYADGFFALEDEAERDYKILQMMRLNAEYAVRYAICDIMVSTAMSDWIDPDSFILRHNGGVYLQFLQPKK